MPVPAPQWPMQPQNERNILGSLYFKHPKVIKGSLIFFFLFHISPNKECRKNCCCPTNMAIQEIYFDAGALLSLRRSTCAWQGGIICTSPARVYLSMFTCSGKNGEMVAGILGQRNHPKTWLLLETFSTSYLFYTHSSCYYGIPMAWLAE